MAYIRSLKDNGGSVFYPLTHEKGVRDSNGVTLDNKLAQMDAKSYVVSWNGTSTPTVGNIPAGVIVTYNSTNYTGTLAASANTMGRVYLVKNGANYDQYITSQSGSSYSWVALGSTALVLTGYATENELDDLAYEVDGKLNGLTKNVTIGRYLYSTGTTVGNSDWCYSNDYIEVSAGDLVTWNPGLTRTDACIVFYDSNKSALSGGYYTANANTRTDPAKPTGATYMRASFGVNNLANARLLVNGRVVWRAVSETTQGANDRITDLEDWINDPSNYASDDDINRVEHEIDVLANGEEINYVSGRILVYSTDSTYARDGWCYNSNYIPVKMDDVLVWTPGTTDSNASVVLYDANKTRLTGWSATSNPRTMTVARNDAAYCRFSFLATQIDNDPLLINGKVAWTPVKVTTKGVNERLDEIEPTVASLDKSVNLMTGAIFNRLGSANGYYTYGSTSLKKSFTNTTSVQHIEIPVSSSLESVKLSGFTYTPSTSNQNVYTRILFFDAEDTILDDIYTITNSEENSMYLAKPEGATQCYVDVPTAHSGEVFVQINASTSSADLDLRVHLTLGDKFNAFNARTGYYTTSNNYKSLVATTQVMNIQIPVDDFLTSVRLTGFTYTPSTASQSVYTRILYYRADGLLLSSASTYTDAQRTEIVLKKPDGAAECYVDVPTIHASEVVVQINSNSAGETDPYDKYLPYVANLAYTKGSNPLVLAHFSDIHGSTGNYGRIGDFAKKMGSYVHDIISTGDNVNNSWADSFTYWTNEKILNVMGNHDTAEYSSNTYNWTAYAGKQAYDRYFAPFIANWGVTQPANAATAGYCYYYKDYTTQGIRLIALDVMEWEIDLEKRQLAWLNSTLDSALDAGRAVVIAAHGPAATGTVTPMNTEWMCYLGWSGGSNVIPSEAVLAVDNFIANGGHFICWIGGHTHKDQVGYMAGHHNQLNIIVGTDASDSNNLSYGDSARISGTDTQDLFNAIAFDATQHQIRIVRIGCNINKQLQPRNTLVLGYSPNGSSAPTVIRES